MLGLLGQTGINLLIRLMAPLLAIISVQFVIDGIKEVFLQIAGGRSQMQHYQPDPFLGDILQ